MHDLPHCHREVCLRPRTDQRWSRCRDTRLRVAALRIAFFTAKLRPRPSGCERGGCSTTLTQASERVEAISDAMQLLPLCRVDGEAGGPGGALGEHLAPERRTGAGRPHVRGAAAAAGALQRRPKHDAGAPPGRPALPRASPRWLPISDRAATDGASGRYWPREELDQPSPCAQDSRFHTTTIAFLLDSSDLPACPTVRPPQRGKTRDPVRPKGHCRKRRHQVSFLRN